MAFDKSTCAALGYYVYRLVDPRTGHTFYVGKGKDERVFSHLEGRIEETSADLLPPKTKAIAAIRRAGLEPIVLIHRHGLDEKTAFTVEAALIDAFPELTNLQSGRASDDYGCRHIQEIQQLYEAKIADLSTIKAVLINIRKSLIEGREVYDAARYHWVVDPKKANAASIVIAHDGGLVRGVFSECLWTRDADKQFFEFHRAGRQATGERYGFVGKPAAFLKHLLGQRLDPTRFQKRGAANPIRYSF